MRELQIGELAGLFGLAPNVLRHWEAMQLISPAARVNGRRRYHQEHVRRVAMIIMGQEVGLTLDDIREVIGAASPSSRRAVFERHIACLNDRLAEIQATKEKIEHALACPMFNDYKACPRCQRKIDVIMQRYSQLSQSSATERRADRRQLAHDPLQRKRR